MALQKEVQENAYHFLHGGGEMGKLTRQFDWSSTPLGSPGQWPHSLRTVVAMVLSSKFPMFVWWEKDLIQFYNDAYRPSLGNNGKHPLALGQKAKDCWPEIWDIIYPLIRQVLETGEATWSEDQLVPIYRNGKIEDVYWTFGYSPLRGDAGDISGVLVVCNETTAKVQTVKKLTESEKRFQSLIREATVGIVVLTGEEMLVEIVNNEYCRIISRHHNDIIGKPIFDVIPETAPYFRDLITAVYTTGKSRHLYAHHYFVFEDGVQKDGFLDIIYQPYIEDNGTMQGVIVLCHDVTEQVLARKRVETSKQRLLSIITAAPVAMCIFKGPSYIVEIANDRMIEFWGKSFNDVINKPIFEGLPEARDQGFEDLLHQVYTTGESYTANAVPVSLPRNGKIELVYVNFVYEAYRESNEHISGIISVANDVTEQVLARQRIEEVVAERTKELATANKNLQRSNAELEQFAYIASHDLQEPLRKVSTFTQMLESHLGEIDDRSKRFLSKINSSSTRMITLIRDVLAYSQLSKDNQIYVQVDLNKIIEGVIIDFELLIEQKKAKIVYDNLPTLQAIPLQMSQLFGNLISNALKFSRTDMEPVIWIRSNLLTEYILRDTSYYQIEIRDNGIGFNQEHADQIFHIFQRLHGSKEYSGTGIGLAMCKKIVQNHHGEIHATASPQNGAIFNMILPERQVEVE